jgi:hypothetical protein
LKQNDLSVEARFFQKDFLHLSNCVNVIRVALRLGKISKKHRALGSHSDSASLANSFVKEKTSLERASECLRVSKPNRLDTVSVQTFSVKGSTSWDSTTVWVPDGLAVGSLLPAGLGEMLGGWDGTHVGVTDGRAIGSLLPDGLVDGERLGPIVDSLQAQ